MSTKRDARDVIIRPVISEKSYGLLDNDSYTFIVHPDATKTEIRDAVQEIFRVKVIRVNTLNRKGKRKRSGRSYNFGRRPDRKRAVVTVAAGESIEIFEG